MGASDSPLLATKMTTLVHELANILDGSLRCLQGLQRHIAREQPPSATAPAPQNPVAISGDTPSAGIDRTGESSHDVATTAMHVSELSISPATLGPPSDPMLINRRLDALHAGLLQMAGLVRAFSGSSSRLGATQIGDAGYSLADTIHHAVEVFAPLAFEHRARLSCDVPPEFARLPSSDMFGVLASAIRNAIDSIDRSRAARDSTRLPDHTIHIVGSILHATDAPSGPACFGPGTRALARIDVIDDGAGLPPSLAQCPERVFEFGYSTKPGCSGIGLALARDTMQTLAGTIALLPADAAASSRLATPLSSSVRSNAQGALLRLEWPVTIPTAPLENPNNPSYRSGGGEA